MLFSPLSQLGLCSSSANSSSLASERVGHVVALVNAVNLDPALVCIQPRLYWYSSSAEAYPKMQEESAEFWMSRSLLYLLLLMEVEEENLQKKNKNEICNQVTSTPLKMGPQILDK